MISFKVPPLGESIVEATVSRWLKKEGDAVATGDTIVELDTDKITVEVPALKAGVLAKQSVKEGEVVKVDQLLGEIDETAADATPTAAATPQPAQAPAPVQQTAETKSSPAARKIADEKGIDINQVQGTGRGGVISKPDVIQAATSAGDRGVASERVSGAQAETEGLQTSSATATSESATPRSPVGRETREKMSTRRKRIAENLLQSQHNTAHLTTFNEIDMSAVSTLRERLKEKIEKDHGVKLSFMPFFVKAACMALKHIPIINSQIDGDEIVHKHYVNMGIAVASEDGLVVPNIKDADKKGMLQISRDIGDLAGRARAKKLTMDDLTGGTFTITNGGVFGSLVSTPIINYPQVGILGLHKIQERPIAMNGQVVIRPMMYVALSYDHRIVDGQHSVLFLVKVKELMEDPASMLVE